MHAYGSCDGFGVQWWRKKCSSKLRGRSSSGCLLDRRLQHSLHHEIFCMNFTAAEFSAIELTTAEFSAIELTAVEFCA